MTLDQWFTLYEQSHQHPLNVLIHKIAVPLILFSIMGMFWGLPASWNGQAIAYGLSTLVLFFYARLSLKYALGMGFFMGGSLLLFSHFSQSPIFYYSAIIFVVAWILQFIGHSIEGKRPSFLQDLTFLLIGPLWTLRFLYRKIRLVS